MKNNAYIELEDGTIFYGESVGAPGTFEGELVFNTAMTGYQEILTDPSYAGQIIVFTTPHIGIVGVNAEDNESGRIWPGAVIMRSYSSYVSSWRSKASLASLLIQQGTIGISGVDTRALTHLIRQSGIQKCCVTACDATVSKTKFHIAVIDYGVKKSILQKLADAGCRITQVLPTTTLAALMQLNIDGVVLSNGPGDPEAYDLETIRLLVDSGIPLFGICLGHQLLARASGAKTIKMRAGHHGTNHPVVDVETKRVYITSQNHNYVVDDEDLPACLQVTHRSLFDGTIGGLRRVDRPAFGFQGHPEASSGPCDIHFMFDAFVMMMEARYAKA